MAIRVTPKSEQIPVNVVGSSSFGDYPKISLEKTYNMFESDGWLVSFPGYHKVLEIVKSGIEGRALFRSFRGNRMIAVIDSNVYDISNSLSFRLVGRLATQTGEVFMDENLNQQICIVDGLNMYIYNYGVTSALTLQTGGVLDGPNAPLIPNYVTYHNTFFLIGNGNKTGNGARWFSYQFATDTTIEMHTEMALQTKPDTALAIKRIPGQASNVLVLGGSVCEVHTQVGGLNTVGQPQDYQRNNSVSIDYGCASVSTIAESDTHIAWLGINESNLPVIMVMTAQSTNRVSTDGIDFFLQNLVHPEQSTAMMYRVNGHLFYQLTFFYQASGAPDDNVTLIYDFNNEKFYHLSDQNLNFHPARQLVFFNVSSVSSTPAPGINQDILDGQSQNIFFISKKGGAIYQLSQNFYDINEDINDDLVAGTDPNLRYEMQRVRIPKSVAFPTSTPFKANQFCFVIEMGQDNIEGIQECLILMITENNIRMFSEMLPNVIPTYKQLVPERHGQEDCSSIPYRGRIDLAISKDSNIAWSNYVSRFMNAQGNGKNILRWNKMGKVNDLNLKIRFWTLGRIVAANGYVEITM